MSAPATITTAAQAAQYAWDRGTSLLAHNTPAASIKQKHFNTRPLADVKAVACGTEQALKNFREEWEALQKKHGVKLPAAPAAAAAAPTQAQVIYRDMVRQYDLWKKNKCPDGAGRGAWWGSRAPGQKGGAKAIPSGEINAIKPLAEKGHWEFKNSFSGDLAWHKKSPDGKVDFIYHTKGP